LIIANKVFRAVIYDHSRRYNSPCVPCLYLYFTTPRLKGDTKTNIKYNIIIVFCNFVQKTYPIRKQKWFQYTSILYFFRCIESFIFRFHIKTISLRLKATTPRNVHCIQLIVNRRVNGAGISTRFVVLLTNVKQECYLILLDYSERFFFSFTGLFDLDLHPPTESHYKIYGCDLT